MTDEHKKDECCSPNSNKGHGCCGTKKMVVGILLVLFIFMCGYVVGKGYCPFACSGKMCPLVQH